MRSDASRGFTIIELTLAMSFVAILLISVALLSIQLSNQYSRGLTLKEVAQAGTEASNDIRRTMAQVQIQNGGVRTKSINGGGTVLCTGTYSYIANSPANLEANNANVVRVGVSGNTTPARLAKVRDLGGVLCSNPSVIDTNKNYVTTDVSELLASGSRQLAVRSLSVSPNGIPGSGPFAEEFQQGRGLYTVNIAIGTGVESEIASDDTCKPPSDLQSNLEFCAIDHFQFTTRVGSTNAR